MNVHISYKIRKTPDLEQEIQHHLQKLQKRLQVFRPELIHVKGTIEQSSARETANISLNLRLPSGQMIAQRSADTPTAAVKCGFDDLMLQLQKHKDLLRSSHRWPRWRRGITRNYISSVPFEETIASVAPPTVTMDDIRSYINANLKRLDSFIDRELSYRESSGELPPNLLTKEEVIDEAISRALSDNVDKPSRLGIEPWLYRLAIRSMMDMSVSDYEYEADVHLEDSAWKPNVRASDEYALQYHQPDESLTGENIIADRRVSTPEDIAYSDEMITLVRVALRSAHPMDREAFVLYAIEGFSIEEISGITDRPIPEVHTSIVDARERLRNSPPIPNLFKDKLLQRTGAA
ncbi:MAG TPA: HPF/RaiA family ribosome-associated protein [Terriglobales bacterium]|jgi:DNA-directed RNA polymerase specialized sigma24 family protein/ribosome-associated translation inhibitor RaiA